MTNFELLAVVVLFLVGYWLVSAVFAHFRRVDGVPAPDGEAWHAVLGVPPGATVDEIERAYRARRDEYLPEKVAALGPELQATAREMTARIDAAYAAALAARRR